MLCRSSLAGLLLFFVLMHWHYYFGDYSTSFQSLLIMMGPWKWGLICTCGVKPATRSCWCKACSCTWYCKKADLSDLRGDMIRIKPKFMVRFPTCLSWVMDTKLIYLAFRNSQNLMTKLRKLLRSSSLKIRFVSWVVDTKLIYLHSGTFGILRRGYGNHHGAEDSKSG